MKRRATTPSSAAAIAAAAMARTTSWWFARAIDDVLAATTSRSPPPTFIDRYRKPGRSRDVETWPSESRASTNVGDRVSAVLPAATWVTVPLAPTTSRVRLL